jgi:DNA invertase Pin-like site-specific DNA recombinase
MANAAFVRSRSDNNASVFAEFETNLRHERQMEGISAAKARGVK